MQFKMNDIEYEIVELNNLEVDYTKPISYYEENAEYVYNDDEAFFNQMLMFSSTVLAFLTGFSVRFAKKKNRKFNGECI